MVTFITCFPSISMIWILTLLCNLMFTLFITAVYVSEQFKTYAITHSLQSSMPLLLQINFYFLRVLY